MEIIDKFLRSLIIKNILIIFMSVSMLFSAEVFDFGSLTLQSRAMALGNSGSAGEEGLGAVFINPAALVSSKELEIVSSTGRFFEDYTAFTLGLAKKLDDQKISVGLIYSGAEIGGVQRVEKIDERPQVLYETSDSRSVIITTVGYRFDEKLIFGANFKYYNHQVFEAAGHGLGIDLGGRYQLFQDLALGAGVRNINRGQIIWNTGVHDELEQEYQVGLTYKFKLIFWALLLNCDQVYPVNYPSYTNYGAELWLVENMLALRGGKNDDLLNLGLGVTFSNFTVDYVYADHEDLETLHKISLSVAL